MTVPDWHADFEARFPTEAAAAAFLTLLRWPEGFVCPRCGAQDACRLSTRPVWDCRPCGAQVSLRSGTVLHGTRKPLRDWLRAAWWTGDPGGISALGLQRELGYSCYGTVLTMLHKLRAALVEREPISGAVCVGTRSFRVSRRAKGDPPPGAAAVVFAVGAVDPPEQRTAAAVDPAAGCESLVRSGVAPGVAVERHRQVEIDRPAHAFEGWVRDRFRGISRRFLTNYLQQHTWLRNRSGRSRIPLSVRAALRLVRRPWRRASDAALALSG